MEIKHEPVEANIPKLDPQKPVTEQDTRREWVEPKLERRGDLSSSTGTFGGFSP